TAFTETQVRLIGRFSKNIVVNFDPDTAGATATDKSLGMLLEEEFNVKVLRLEAGFDPDLFIRRNGAQAYKQALAGSLKYFDYLVDRTMSMFAVRTPEGKKNAVNYLLPHLHHVPNRIEREALANDIAQKLGISSEVLRQEFKSAATKRGTREVHVSAATEVMPAEKVLIRAAATVTEEHAELRRNVLDALRSERLHQGLNTERLLELLLENEASLDGPLALPMEDADRNLLAAILMHENEPLTEDLVEGALEALRHRRQIAQREREIKRGIVEAERKNDAMALVRLKQEKLDLDRKLAAGLK
ncbi:MAG TPA: toprim domain-containing protein, partial [Candidatus Angelobacter sp.]|nr:toprim domain-containing protein [Candidatus Angelobacter sp.]